jgi:hypothetical protein
MVELGGNTPPAGAFGDEGFEDSSPVPRWTCIEFEPNGNEHRAITERVGEERAGVDSDL